jgi:predicted CXXCH cytochrome family protein
MIMGRKLRRWGLALAAAVLIASPLGAAALESDACLGCHGDAEAVGEELAVDPSAFDHTAHGEMGCSACHASVTDEHPDDGPAPTKAGCRDCHPDVADEYAATGHAGNVACGDCHNPHAAHSSREVSGNDMNHTCFACHGNDEMAAAHGSWLPQADLHLEMLPCVTCHTASEDYVITLYLSKPGAREGAGYMIFELADHEELAKLANGGDIGSLIDTDGDDFVSLAELRAFSVAPRTRTLRLKGMLMPEVVTHNLQILDNRRDCTFCHASGPGAMQTSFVALPRPDGTYDRMRVEQGAILDALNGTPDFYMMGATRNASLNILGLLILAGGLVMPVGHGALRFLTRKNRR